MILRIFIKYINNDDYEISFYLNSQGDKKRNKSYKDEIHV